MKKYGVLLALLLLSTALFADDNAPPTRVFKVKGTLTAAGYGNADAEGNGTMHISVPAGSRATVTLYDVGTAFKIFGKGIDWKVRDEGVKRIWEGSGVLTIIGTNAYVTAIAGANSKVNLFLSGYGKATLKGYGKYSASSRLHDTTLSASAPVTAPSGKPFEAKIVLTNKGSYLEKLSVNWDFVPVDIDLTRPSCLAIKEGSFDVSLNKGQSEPKLVSLTVAEGCEGMYVFGATSSGKSKDAYPADNLGSAVVFVTKGGGEEPTVDVAVTKVEVPAKVDLNKEFEAKVTLRNNGNVKASGSLLSSITPDNRGCGNDARPGVSIDLDPNEEKMYTYTKLIVKECPGNYNFQSIADVTGGDVKPDDNSKQTPFTVGETRKHDAKVEITTLPVKVNLDEKFTASVTVTNKGGFDERVVLSSKIIPSKDVVGGVLCKATKDFESVTLDVAAGKTVKHDYKDNVYSSCSGKHTFSTELDGFTDTTSSDNKDTQEFTVTMLRNVGDPSNPGNPNN